MIKVVSNQEQTKTGPLPIAFNSDGTPLTDYKLYGTAEGAGAETENLWDESWVNGLYSSVGAYVHSSNDTIASDPDKPIPVQGGATYYIKQFKNVSKMEVFFYSSATTGFIRYDTIDPDVSNSFVTPQSATYMRFDCYKRYGAVYANDIVISSAFPTAYVPHGYKIPLTVESGEESTTTPIYIGDSKLMAEEYADYGEQKVYKRTENLFNKDAVDPRTDIYLKSDGLIAKLGGRNQWTISNYIPVSTGTYTAFGLSKDGQGTYCCIYDSNKNFIRSQLITAKESVTFTFVSGENFVRLSIRLIANEINNAMLVEGSTPPETYIPYLQPTDPPVALPELSTYQGENTLSCSEGLGDESQITYVGPKEETIVKIMRTEDDGQGNVTEHVLYKEGS